MRRMPLFPRFCAHWSRTTKPKKVLNFVQNTAFPKQQRSLEKHIFALAKCIVCLQVSLAASMPCALRIDALILRVNVPNEQADLAQGACKLQNWKPMCGGPLSIIWKLPNLEFIGIGLEANAENTTLGGFGKGCPPKKAKHYTVFSGRYHQRQISGVMPRLLSSCQTNLACRPKHNISHKLIRTKGGKKPNGIVFAGQTANWGANQNCLSSQYPIAWMLLWLKTHVQVPSSNFAEHF